MTKKDNPSNKEEVVITNSEITSAMREALSYPLDEKALSPYPGPGNLTAIKPIYIVERLNDVFGVGGWIATYEVIPTQGDMAVVKCNLDIPKYDVHIEQFGGNKNRDLGDSYKGAATDALNKCASYLEIGIDIYKQSTPTPQNNQPQYVPSQSDANNGPVQQQMNTNAPKQHVGGQCPQCGGVNVTNIPAGVSKNTGKPYDAFNSCKDCKHTFY